MVLLFCTANNNNIAVREREGLIMKRRVFQKGVSALLMLTIASGVFMETKEVSAAPKSNSNSAQILEKWYEKYQVSGNSFEGGNDLEEGVVYNQAQTYYCGRSGLLVV